MSAELKPCPWCAESIHPDARKCRYCKEFLPDDWAEPPSKDQHPIFTHGPVIGGLNPRGEPGPSPRAKRAESTRPASQSSTSRLATPGYGMGPALVWMIFLSILLSFAPFLGPFIAGFIGGRKAGGLINALLAAVIPSLVLAHLLLILASKLAGIPILGSIVTFGAVGLAFAGAGPLVLGAALGGAMSPAQYVPTSPLAVMTVLILGLVLGGTLARSIYRALESAHRAIERVQANPTTSGPPKWARAG